MKLKKGHGGHGLLRKKKYNSHVMKGELGEKIKVKCGGRWSNKTEERSWEAIINTKSLLERKMAT